MNPFEHITPLTEEEKKAVREKLMKGTPKPETREEKEQRRAEFAKKMSGKNLEEMGKTIAQEKYVPGKKRDGEAA